MSKNLQPQTGWSGFHTGDNHETPSRMRLEPDALISPACTSSTCQCGSPPRVKTEPFQWQARHSMGLWGQSQTLLMVLMTSSVITLPLLLTPALKNNIYPVCHYQAVAVHHLGLLRHPENCSPYIRNRSST